MISSAAKPVAIARIFHLLVRGHRVQDYRAVCDFGQHKAARWRLLNWRANLRGHHRRGRALANLSEGEKAEAAKAKQHHDPG